MGPSPSTRRVTSRLCLQDAEPVLPGCAQNSSTRLQGEPVGTCHAPLTLGHASFLIAWVGACCCIKVLEETLLWQYKLVSLRDG